MGSPHYILYTVQLNLCHCLLIITGRINCNPWHKCWFTQLILLTDPSVLSRACCAPKLQLLWCSYWTSRGLYEQGNCVYSGQCSASLMKMKNYRVIETQGRKGPRMKAAEPQCSAWLCCSGAGRGRLSTSVRFFIWQQEVVISLLFCAV